MNRRKFVKTLPMISAGAASSGAVLSLGGCASVPYIRAAGIGPELRVPSAQVDQSTGAFVETTARPWPLYVHRSADGAYTAVAASCTHRGCQPDRQGDRLVCPCHGSEFGLSGALLQGPATRPLERFAVDVDGNDLVIRLDRGLDR